MPRGITESISEARRKATVSPGPLEIQRQGYVTGVPLGGATQSNPGQSATGGALDRRTYMDQLVQSYMACPYSASCVDTIARTITAGGLQCVPNSFNLENDVIPDPTPQIIEIQELLEYVNPYDDVRQLMRGVITDLLVFGDSFTEVVYLMGKPIALYPLDPATITVLCNEHGTITGYLQKMETGLETTFDPHEIVHVKYDAPGSGIYGVSPTQKNILPITIWLFTSALVKETMRKGDPLRAHVDWPTGLPEPEMKRLSEQYQIQNLGAKNIGALFQTKGGTVVHELGINQLNEWSLVLVQMRDQILSGYGTPPSKVGIVESGNIGGGTGTAQDRSFNINTCGPISEMVLEKFSFHLMYQCYGIKDWHLQFGQVDWRDDLVIEQIADMRIRNGRWSLDRARAIIGEDPVPGGSDAVLVDRANLVLWKDLESLSNASVQAIVAKGSAGQPGVTPSSPSPPGTGVDSISGGESLARKAWREHQARKNKVLEDLRS